MPSGTVYISEQIADGRDEAHELTLLPKPFPGFGFYVGGSTLLVNSDLNPLNRYFAGLRFTPPVPQGAEILTAHLMVFCDWHQDVCADILGQDSDNAANFVDVPHIVDPTVRRRTTASVPWVEEDMPLQWVSSPDITAIVQEIVNRAGWSPSNGMVLLLEGQVAPNEILHFRGAPLSLAAKLVISYRGDKPPTTTTSTTEAPPPTTSTTEAPPTTSTTEGPPPTSTTEPPGGSTSSTEPPGPTTSTTQGPGPSSTTSTTQAPGPSPENGDGMEGPCIGGPINLLNQVTALGANAAGFFSWSDDFRRDSPTLGGGWTTAPWFTARTAPTAMHQDDITVPRGKSAAVCQELAYNPDSTYVVEIFITPNKGQHWGDYYLFLRMNDSNPNVYYNGVAFKLALGETGAYVLTVVGYENSFQVNSATVSGNGTVNGGWFSVRFIGDEFDVFWQGSVLIQGPTVGTAAGKRLGFAEEVRSGEEYPDAVCLVDEFRVTAIAAVAGKRKDRRTYLVAGGGEDGRLYAEQTVGALELVCGPAARIAPDRLIHATERGQLLYMADYWPARISGTAGTIGPSGDRLTDAAVVDWTALEIDRYVDMVNITQPTGDVEEGNYEISGVAAAELTLATSAGGAGTCAYIIGRAPKIYNPVTDEVTLWTATPGKGLVPLNCPLICNYRDRAVLAGGPEGHLWWASRQGDWHDFDYNADDRDAQRAVAATNSDAGRVGDIITALIPYSDDFLTFGCRGSIWVLRGDPAMGGMIDNVSYKLGILDKGAWCHGHKGRIYFLSEGGLYQLGLGAGNQMLAEPMSRQKLPQELIAVDPLEYRIQLAWDEEAQGVHIYLTPEDSHNAIHWFWDFQLKSFWRDSHYAEHGPMTVWNYKTEIIGNGGLLLGGRDGCIRRYLPGDETDDGQDIESYAYLRPVRLDQSDLHEGVLAQLDGSLGAGSGDVRWDVFVGATHEEAVDASASFAHGTWSGDGLQRTTRPRARGGSAVIKLSSPGKGAWTVEKLTGVSVAAGRHRR